MHSFTAASWVEVEHPTMLQNEDAAYNNHNDQNCRAFCDCVFPNSIQIMMHKGHVPDMVTCRCGEEEASGRQWAWYAPKGDTNAAVIGPDITFHPVYSQGTAIVRGEKPLKEGMVHFWEIRVLTALAGTDVMFGIGTDKVSLDQFKFHFVSALGTNAQSWGYSYNGKVQHNGQTRPYGGKITQGCILGVCLDRVRGHLEFFLNRRSLGVAFTDISNDPSVELYPMVCSTAAKSAIRLMNATSQPDSLQLRAFKALSKQPRALKELRAMPGLRRILRDFWFLTPPVRYSPRSNDSELDILDEAVLPTKTMRAQRKQKFKDEDADINDLYSNAHKIASHHQNRDSDEDFPVNEYFDEYFHYIF